MPWTTSAISSPRCSARVKALPARCKGRRGKELAFGIFEKGEAHGRFGADAGGYPPVLPVTAGERALYRALREQVPIIDAAIYKLVRLIGGFEVYCPEKHTGKRAARVFKNRARKRLQHGHR